MDLWRCGRIRCMPPPGPACVLQEYGFLFSNHTIGTNGPSELPCTQRDHIKNNLGTLNEMHINQQNHWNDSLFYWYQLHHWYQWTIGIALYPVRSHGKTINNTSPLMRCIFTNGTIGMTFYWCQSYHWYQWTIGIALYPARSHEKISPLNEMHIHR